MSANVLLIIPMAASKPGIERIMAGFRGSISRVTGIHKDSVDSLWKIQTTSDGNVITVRLNDFNSAVKITQDFKESSRLSIGNDLKFSIQLHIPFGD